MQKKFNKFVKSRPDCRDCDRLAPRTRYRYESTALTLQVCNSEYRLALALAPPTVSENNQLRRPAASAKTSPFPIRLRWIFCNTSSKPAATVTTSIVVVDANVALARYLSGNAANPKYAIVRET